MQVCATTCFGLRGCSSKTWNVSTSGWCRYSMLKVVKNVLADVSSFSPSSLLSTHLYGVQYMHILQDVTLNIYWYWKYSDFTAQLTWEEVAGQSALGITQNLPSPPVFLHGMLTCFLSPTSVCPQFRLEDTGGGKELLSTKLNFCFILPLPNCWSSPKP